MQVQLCVDYKLNSFMPCTAGFLGDKDQQKTAYGLLAVVWGAIAFTKIFATQMFFDHVFATTDPHVGLLGLTKLAGFSSLAPAVAAYTLVVIYIFEPFPDSLPQLWCIPTYGVQHTPATFACHCLHGSQFAVIDCPARTFISSNDDTPCLHEQLCTQLDLGQQSLPLCIITQTSSIMNWHACGPFVTKSHLLLAPERLLYPLCVVS